MSEELYKYTASSTSDHYYDRERDTLRITYSPSETAILFELEKDKNPSTLDEIIRNEAQRLIDVQNDSNKKLESRLIMHKGLAKALGKDNLIAIRAVMSSKNLEYDTVYKELIYMAKEMSLENDWNLRILSSLSKRSIEISKQHPNREVEEYYNPYCLKSHLECWPFEKNSKINMDFKRLYLNMNKDHIQSRPSDNEVIWKYIMSMPITIVPYEKS